MPLALSSWRDLTFPIPLPCHGLLDHPEALVDKSLWYWMAWSPGWCYSGRWQNSDVGEGFGRSFSHRCCALEGNFGILTSSCFSFMCPAPEIGDFLYSALPLWRAKSKNEEATRSCTRATAVVHLKLPFLPIIDPFLLKKVFPQVLAD